MAILEPVTAPNPPQARTDAIASPPGTRLTHYEILGPLGAGGMGEVWRARDTRLEREIAIKVLPDELADDEERLRRFEREAKTLASLNHTNLAHVYGIDQVEDTCFIAMELVPGQDLAAKLARGPMPVDEAVDICRQIAEGLEAAHEAGIVHRDLKPANVRVTPEGVVKILDFGLAKPLQARSTGSGTTTAQSDSFLMTEEGLVLGTPTYMSPEQARGKRVDRRTDIWAFGCVLYECLTGERVFDGESLTDVLASIVGEEPDWSCLPGDVEPHVLRLLLRCLEKDPRERLRDVGEARIALARGAPEPVDRSRESPRSRPAPVLAVGLIALVVGALGAWFLRPEGKGGHPGVTETGPRKTTPDRACSGLDRQRPDALARRAEDRLPAGRLALAARPRGHGAVQDPRHRERRALACLVPRLRIDRVQAGRPSRDAEARRVAGRATLRLARAALGVLLLG